MNRLRQFCRVLLLVLSIGGIMDNAIAQKSMSTSQNTAKATFAGGCFWCMEPPFDRLEGVLKTTSGYCGGTEVDPSYEAVSSGKTGHAEAIEVLYDVSKVTYEELLETFWQSIDPTQADGQFADKGKQYRTAIFFHDEAQKRLAESSKAKLEASGKFDKPIITEIVAATPFYPAEEHHQDYYEKHPLHYKLYRIGSGRAGFLKKTWGK